MHLLLVEDNRSLSSWLMQALHKSGYAVDSVADGEAALITLQGQHFDAVILDLGLPRLSGEEVLRRVRGTGNDVPILILTAEGSLQTRIKGLNDGADDFLSKPFDLGELEARLRSIMRRKSGLKSPEISCGTLRLDTNTREFFIGDEAIHLTPREHAVLEMLIFNMGKTVTKTKLTDSVFNLDDEISSSTIEVYVSRLRRKLQASDARIFTLRGLGYLLKKSSAPPTEDI
jgi:two-component system response regulator TctD